VTAQPSSFPCCGVRIDALDPDGAAEALLESRFGEPRVAHLCNAYTLSLAVRDEAFRAVLDAGDLNLSDGHYVAMVGRRRGLAEMSSRVYGPDLMAAVLDRGRNRELRHYLYGSTPETVQRLGAALAERYPGVSVVGAESPPFRPLSGDETEQMVQRIRATRPDIVWVGLGTPRQDVFVHDFRDRLGTTLVPVGAAFDFFAGTKPMAPQWVQQRGLEWAYRLATEPRRLWKRYLVGNPVFVYGVVREEARTRRARTA
jgi:N-acetylglucosaminyldiphosphoundecaprenol N-acetyl-beta-D-mannosaminyltransferase